MILSEIKFAEVWPIIATIVGVASGVCTAALWFSINSLKESIKATSEQQSIDRKAVSDLKDSMVVCRRECDDNYASKEDYLREAGYTRRFQEIQIASMAKIEARLDIVQQLPEIAGQVAKAVVVEMKRGA